MGHAYFNSRLLAVHKPHLDQWHHHSLDPFGLDPYNQDHY